MQIGHLTQTENIYQARQKVASSTPPETNTNKQDPVSISSTGRNAEAKWQDIASQYNMTDISTKERASMADELRKDNSISAEQHLRLAAPLNMDDDLSTKVDYLTLARNSKAVAEGVPAALKSLNILEHLHELSENINNKTANTTSKTADY